MHRSKVAEAKHHRHSSAPDAKRNASARQSERKGAAHAVVPSIPLPIARPAAASLPPDLAATKQAIELVRQGKPSEVTLIATSIGDPVAQKLVEWTLLRHPESEVKFERYTAFIRANPNWPGISLLRRRAEARLWQDRHDAATVRRFFGEEQPTSPLGRLAFARTLKAEGDEAGAAREVRAIWPSAELSAELEATLLDEFQRADTRRRRRTHGLAHRRQRFRCGDACCKASRRRRNGDCQSLRRHRGGTPPRRGRCLTRFPARHVAIWASRYAAFTG